MLAIVLFLYVLGSLFAVFGVIVLHKRSGVPQFWAVTILVPVLVWMIVGKIVGHHGSLSNFFIEPLCLGVAVSVTEVIRLLVPARTEFQARHLFGVAFGLRILLALGFTLWFPILPE
jgi:hypothetical protein